MKFCSGYWLFVCSIAEFNKMFTKALAGSTYDVAMNPKSQLILGPQMYRDEVLTSCKKRPSNIAKRKQTIWKPIPAWAPGMLWSAVV